MDSEFNQRWRAALAPFDGVTIFLEEYAPLSDLRRVLAVVVDCLHTYSPAARLFRMLDWHEHDGYVTEAVPATWQELLAITASEDALKAASMGDSYVRTAFYPEQRDFLLRFYVPDTSDSPFPAHDDRYLAHYGIFDLTCQERLAIQVRKIVQEEANLALKTMPAKAFFDGCGV